MNTPSWLIVALTTVTIGPLAYSFGQRAGKDEGVLLAGIVASNLGKQCEEELAQLWREHGEAELARGEALEQSKKYDP